MRVSLRGKTTLRLEKAAGEWFLHFALTSEIAEEVKALLREDPQRSADFLEQAVATLDAGVEMEVYGSDRNPDRVAITVRFGPASTRKAVSEASGRSGGPIGAQGVSTTAPIVPPPLGGSG
jgi:hypothetical protein